VDERISTYRVYVIFQYFAICFNRIVQDTIKGFKAVGEVLLVLFSGDWKVILEETLLLKLDRSGYICRVMLKPV